jgi:hypothetical protein
MSTAALNVCSVREMHLARRVRETHLQRALLAKRTSPRPAISSRSWGLSRFLCNKNGTVPFPSPDPGKIANCCPKISTSVASGNRPSPRPRKNRHFDPKNFDHIGRIKHTSLCHSTASGSPPSLFAVRRKRAKMQHPYFGNSATFVQDLFRKPKWLQYLLPHDSTQEMQHLSEALHNR